MQARLLLVRNLWIGNPGSIDFDLYYGSSSWPITIIHRILWLCTNLRNLFIINLGQNNWSHLENAIPASLESLAMGPIHGPFLIKNLTRKPRIKSFTSAESFMRDNEVQDTVLYPHLRIFRRIFRTETGSFKPFWAINQALCISKSQTLKEMEILLFGRPEDTEFTLEQLKTNLKEVMDDKRVIVRWRQPHTWIEFLRLEFIAEEESFIGAFIHW
jgi:hypothetical protein